VNRDRRRRAPEASKEVSLRTASDAVDIGEGGLSSDEVLVTVDGVSKEFHQGANNVRALDNVSLKIRRGEFVTIVGASGCGKTTLLNMMANFMAPTSGRIVEDPTVSRRGGIGMVFQNPVLLPWRNVLGNVLAPAEIYGMDGAVARSRADDLLRQVDLKGFERAMPYQLSGGMQQRVAICRALLSDPPLLLMDEPFGALDALTRERMNLELQRIFLLGQKTVVLVTHSIEEAVFLSDRIVAMTPRPGRIAEVIENKLPRPRTVESYDAPLFIEYAGHLRKLVMASAPIAA
jgi:NitT/TauT family transport system ATP-binding protein